jgi:hypothetical protein
MKTGTVVHDSTRAAFDVSILAIRPGRFMLLANGASQNDLPTDAAVRIVVGDEIWLAELISRGKHGESAAIVADVRYRVPRQSNANWDYVEEERLQQRICDPGSQQCRSAQAAFRRAVTVA